MDPVSSIEENIDTSGSDTETPNSTQEYSPNIIISQMNTKTNPLQVSEMMRKYDWRASETDESSYSETEIYDIEQRKQLTLTINKSKSKSNLLRVSSNNEWESEDMNDLEYDMKRELKHQILISQSVYNSTSTNYKEINESMNNSDNMDEDDTLDTPASLFRLKSADKWNNQHITVQKEQMKKQMVHLALNHNTFSNDNI